MEKLNYKTNLWKLEEFFDKDDNNWSISAFAYGNYDPKGLEGLGEIEEVIQKGGGRWRFLNGTQ